MSEVIITSIAIKLLMGCIGLVAMLFGLRAFDRWAGIDFRKGFNLIESNPMALAMYFGLRLIAWSLVLVGTLL